MVKAQQSATVALKLSCCNFVKMTMQPEHFADSDFLGNQIC